jgi:hypothetical protein
LTRWPRGRPVALLFWFALGAGLITLAVWLALGEPDQAIERTVTVLVIACPHARLRKVIAGLRRAPAGRG